MTERSWLDPRLAPHVTDRPIGEAVNDPYVCPHCGTDDEQRVEGSRSTCLGWSGKGADPNHVWTQCFCTACGHSYTRETAKGNVWYTTRHLAGGTKLLRGVPSCYESYLYSCAHCSIGNVERTYLRVSDDQPTEALRSTRHADGTWSHAQYPVYTCRQCGHRTELREETP